jgi:hypothetical protein
MTTALVFFQFWEPTQGPKVLNQIPADSGGTREQAVNLLALRLQWFESTPAQAS